ncbi:hypothetical protein B0H63DRAFT_556706 [Podospora didyma]|uniref:Modin n=1 Tax=Podospora didyma TaxID=330526 RepID=A0AAE0NXS5_9PEZI|nr:hypothetical protein B0H63DRAFT_556706 [Podospora didyma]
MDKQDQIATAALVISTLALLGVVVQYVQAVLSKVNGLPSKDREVSGLWANYAHIKWRAFRADVEFEAPIIFLAPNNNMKGPVHGKPIWYVNGTGESCDEIRVSRLPSDPEAAQRAMVQRTQSGLTREPVHTVKNELVTWILVLEATQKMEADSKRWERIKWSNTNVHYTLPGDKDFVSLSVNIQAMKRSFDKHPTIKKPFATTTICHLVELCAMLGIFWKEFDRDNNKYRAEGNGYSLLGHRMPDLGLAFTFEKPGWPRFEKNRVIPTAEVKELCFGNVPTFYRPQSEDEHWRQPVNEQPELKTLQLGSRVEIAETLSLMRCNEYTTLCYSDPAKKHVHLFPVIFEVMGMLARPLHLMDRAFTYLPNPVVFPFSKQAFSLRRLLAEFSKHLSDEIKLATYPLPEALENIDAAATKLNRILPQQDNDFSPVLLKDLHAAIDDVDRTVLTEDRNAKEVVLDVLRRHVQEVLLAINTSARDIELGLDHSPSAGTTRTTTHPAHLHQSTDESIIKGEISFDDLLKVPHEKRESSLMKKYFDEVRLRAVSTSKEHHDPQAAAASRDIHRDEQEHEGTAAAQNALGLLTQQPLPEQDEDDQEAAASQSHPTTSQSENPTPVPNRGFPTFGRRATTFSVRSLTRAESWRNPKTPPTQTEIRRHTIWCALVFRMICWLLLHDFDKKDVQLPKSELMGSRLSAFIL